MATMDLEMRKRRALEVSASYDSEEAIARLERIADNFGRYCTRKQMERPNCFTVGEVKDMLKKTMKDAKQGKGYSQEEMHEFRNRWRQ